MKVGGHITIKELQTREKRVLVTGIGVLVEGKKVLAPYCSIISSFDYGLRYGNEEIYFRPFSHFEVVLKVKDVFYPTQNSQNDPKYCLLEVEGMFWA